MIGSVYCLTLERKLKLDEYYLYYAPTILLLVLIHPIYFLLFKLLAKHKILELTLLN